MLKSLLNLDLFIKYRKSYLEMLLNTVRKYSGKKDVFGDEKQIFCCHIESWQTLFMCWKELKEVKENMSSTFLTNVKGVSNPNCGMVWFRTNEDRASFLKECLNKFNK